MATFDNRGMRFAGGARTTSKKLSHIKRAAAARKVMEGYPIETPFNDPKEVWEYLNADKIICLRCGKPYKALGRHLQVHGWDEGKYKEFYGLPWNTGLTSTATKYLKKSIGKSNFVEGKQFGDDRQSNRAKAHNAPRRKSAPYTKKVAIVNMYTGSSLKETDGGNLVVWIERDYYKALEIAVEKDIAPTDVSKSHNVPTISAMRLFAQQNPDFALAKASTWEKLSFRAQAQHQMLGARFVATATQMRLDGKTNREIGAELGVSLAAVSHYVSTVKKPEKTHCAHGHEYPEQGPKRCKICNTEDARRRRGNMEKNKSAVTMITVNCSICGAPMQRSRLAGHKRKARCKACYAEYYKNHGKKRRMKGKASV